MAFQGSSGAEETRVQAQSSLIIRQNRQLPLLLTQAKQCLVRRRISAYLKTLESEPYIKKTSGNSVVKARMFPRICLVKFKTP
jgi:hypothetical protein